LASAAAALLTVQAYAQNPAPEASAPAQTQAETPQIMEEVVVVRGRRMSEIQFDLRNYAREFIGTVAAPPPGRGYARWNRSVCVGVHNLESTAAQYIVDRISLLVNEVGLEPGEPGCNPDVIVIFTTDGKAVATSMVEQEPLLFRPGVGVCCMQLGLDALEEFQESDKAVRWWHVSMPVDARTGQRAIRMPQDDRYPVIAVAGPSRIHNGTRDDLFRVIIIVDGTKLTGTTWQQIGDYLAVVSLAQIDPNANPAAFDSILNLFSNPAAYSGLTDWDRSYIQALYEFDQERMPQMQADEVVSRMAKRESAGGAD
jgi:hypothetical protein